MRADRDVVDQRREEICRLRSNVEDLRARLEQSTKQATGAKTSKGKAQKRLREGVEVDFKSSHSEIGRNTIDVLKSLKLALDKLTQAESKSIRRLDLRRLYSQATTVRLLRFGWVCQLELYPWLF